MPPSPVGKLFSRSRTAAWAVLVAVVLAGVTPLRAQCSLCDEEKNVRIRLRGSVAMAGHAGGPSAALIEVYRGDSFVSSHGVSGSGGSCVEWPSSGDINIVAKVGR